MATIVGGMANGLTRKRAAEFSFFLAVPPYGWCNDTDLHDLLNGDSSWASAHDLIMLAVGCVISFIVALLAMKWFVSFLAKYGFKVVRLVSYHRWRYHYYNAALWYSTEYGWLIHILIAPMNFKEGVIIPIDKPHGITSFKALAHIRYLCTQANDGKVKIGHAGTFRPLATGVLILATGKMTKQIETLQTHTKGIYSYSSVGSNHTELRYGHEVNETFQQNT